VGNFDENGNSDFHDNDRDNVPSSTRASFPAITTLTEKQMTNICVCSGLPHDVTTLLKDCCPDIFYYDRM